MVAVSRFCDFKHSLWFQRMFLNLHPPDNLLFLFLFYNELNDEYYYISWSVSKEETFDEVDFSERLFWRLVYVVR